MSSTEHDPSTRSSEPNLQKMTPNRHRGGAGFSSHANILHTNPRTDADNAPPLPNYLCRPYQPGLRSIIPSPMMRCGSPSVTPGTYPTINTPYTSRKPVARSHTYKKQVELFQGNLVLDCPVPTRLMEASARKEKEFSMMRYSAVTCDPNDFANSNYTLRPQLMNRQTELFIVMTMYNVNLHFFPSNVNTYNNSFFIL
jgi:hypothetical protein